MNQTMVPINCEACDGIALTVPEQDYANTLDGLLCDCLSCGATGKVGLIGDDDSGIRFFPHPGLTPTRTTYMLWELQRQVTTERERQHGIEFRPLGDSRWSTNARHAKRLAGWPSGEWQGMKVGG